MLFFRHKNPETFLPQCDYRPQLPVDNLQKALDRPGRHGGLRAIWLDQRSSDGPRTQDSRLLDERRRLEMVKRKTDKDDALKLARMAAMGELDIELTQLDSLSKQIDAVVKKLEAIGKNDPRIVRLRTIPGVGPRTAEILVACIDDPHRFGNGRQVSAYFGLVPRQFQSGETDRNGRITKRGNSLARTIPVECAWASLRYNPWAKGVYDRICGNQKTRKKKAGVTLARKIAVIAWAMLRDQKGWDPSTMIRTTKSFGGKLPMDEETFRTMRPKKNLDQPKCAEHRYPMTTDFILWIDRR